MNVNDEFSSPDSIKKPGVFNNRRFRVLDDLSNRYGTPESDGSPLPKICEENEDGKENLPRHETTPIKRVTHKTRKESGDVPPASSTPLSRRPPLTPKTPQHHIPHNPFENALLSRLHRPICSPSVFSIVVSPTRSLDENFEWPIEDLSRIKPASIEEFPESQFAHVEDPETESLVQEAINTFFKEKHIVPSPGSSDDEHRSLLKSKIRENIIESKDVASQTVLSLPLVLPPELEAALKPYFNQEANEATDEEAEMNTSNPSPSVEEVLSQSGLRRKLLFHVSEEVCQISPSSPLTSACWKQGLSRTDIPSGSRSGLRSPTLSPIGRDSCTPTSPKHSNTSVMYSSQMSMDVSYQSSPDTPFLSEHPHHHSVISAITEEGEEEMSSQGAWGMRRHLHIEEETDQTMDSCNGTPILGNSPLPPLKHLSNNITTDLGYHTHDSNSTNFAHSKLQLDSWVESDAQ